MRLIRSTLAGIALAVVMSSAPTAHAEGVEVTTSGTIGLGRAATSLRVNDFMATWLNPANLAVLPGNDLGLELRVPLLHACFDRARDNSLDYRGGESFAEVCNKGGVMPTGNLGWAQSFPRGWGYGVGFFTPAAIPKLKYGEDTIVTLFPLANERYPTTPNGTLSPNRFLLLERELIGGFLQAGAGVQLHRLVRVGASVGLGFVSLHNVNVGSVQGGTFQDQESRIDLHASDWVIPRATVSVVVEPLESLSLLAAVTYQSDIRGNGYVDFTNNGIRDAPRTDCRVSDPDEPGPHCRSDDATARVPFPRLQATLGVRYAKRRTGRTRALDPMRDERWDIELNGTWSQTSHVDRYRVQLYDQAPGSPGSTRLTFSSDPSTVPLAAPSSSVVEYQWRDTFGLRLGGDYNVIPAVLALRAGLSYESNATPREYMNIDAFAVNRYGLHVGATWALGKLKLSVAYAHVFFQSVDVKVGQGRIYELVAVPAMPADAAKAVNEGSYSAALDVISVQANLAL